MSKTKRMILAIGVPFIVIAIAIIMVLIFKEPTVEINAKNLTVEFDGSAHAIQAFASSSEGKLSYEYVGADNDYRSALEPTEAGEYNVKVTFEPFKGNKTVTTEVKLTITLPYTLDETGTIISEYTGKQKDVVLPKTYKNKVIEALGDNTFSEDITSVKMPDNIFYVSPNAFNNGVTLYIHENTKVLSGDYTDFKIEYYGYPQSVYSDTFGEIIGISELTLPESIKTIEKEALSKIRIGKLILSSDLPLTSQVLSDTTKYVKVNMKAGMLADYFFENTGHIETIEIEGEVKVFGEKAFYNCLSLKKLILHSVPEQVGENCFSEDFTLKEILFNVDKPQMGWKLKSLGIKTIERAELIDAEDLQSDIFWNNISILKVVLPDSIKVIEQQAFENCTNLKEIKLPEGLEILPLGIFRNCTSLTKISLPESLKTIESSAFDGCSSLTEVDIKEGVKTIEYYAFANCDSLTSIVIPDSVETILDGVFRFSDNLKNVTLSASLKEISPVMFEGCESLTSVVVPSEVTSIGFYAFAHCSSLEELILPQNLTTIGNNAFCFCTWLQKLVLPEKVAFLGDELFIRCDYLADLTISSPIMPSIGKDVLSGNVAGLSKNAIIRVPGNLLSEYKELYPSFNFVAIED